MEDDVRRCLTSRFPYGVLYSIETDEVFILAVMHLNRNPDDALQTQQMKAIFLCLQEI